MKIPKNIKLPTLFSILALSAPIIAHAVEPEPVTAADCGRNLFQSFTNYVLVDDLVCDFASTGGAPALTLSAFYSRLSLNKHFIRFKYTTPGGDVDLDGIVITGGGNTVEGPGLVNLFRDNIVIDGSIGGGNNNIIKGLTIKSSTEDFDGEGGDGIRLENASDNRVYNNKIKNSDDSGVELINSNTNIIADNGIFRSGSDGIDLKVTEDGKETSGNLITYNLIQLIGDDGVELTNDIFNDDHLLNENIISYNKIIDSAGIGISIVDGDRNAISFNKTRNTDSEGVRIVSADNNIIEHNDIANVFTTSGIQILNGNENIVKYNTIAKVVDRGIELQAVSSNNTITHNDITTSRESGIALGSGNEDEVENDNRITNNHIHDSGQSGILLFATENDMINNNTISDNHISASNRQAISLLDSDEAGGTNEIDGNIIDGNQVKHDVFASAAFSQCTKLGDENTWVNNVVNGFLIPPGEPLCELT